MHVLRPTTRRWHYLLLGLLLLGTADSARAAKQDRPPLSERWKQWLDDVDYIIADYEREVFQSFNNDEEREEFVAGFWERRTPADMTPEETREEHYRRLEYADKKFHAGVPGRRAIGPYNRLSCRACRGTPVRPRSDAQTQGAENP